MLCSVLARRDIDEALFSFVLPRSVQASVQDTRLKYPPPPRALDGSCRLALTERHCWATGASGGCQASSKKSTTAGSGETCADASLCSLHSSPSTCHHDEFMITCSSG
eukprot:3636924-Rhodomonas_salina.1